MTTISSSCTLISLSHSMLTHHQHHHHPHPHPFSNTEIQHSLQVIWVEMSDAGNAYPLGSLIRHLWFLARKPACGKRLTTNWSCTSPCVTSQVDKHKACRFDLLLSVVSDNKKCCFECPAFKVINVIARSIDQTVSEWRSLQG